MREISGHEYALWCDVYRVVKRAQEERLSAELACLREEVSPRRFFRALSRVICADYRSLRDSPANALPDRFIQRIALGRHLYERRSRMR